MVRFVPTVPDELFSGDKAQQQNPVDLLHALAGYPQKSGRQRCADLLELQARRGCYIPEDSMVEGGEILTALWKQMLADAKQTHLYQKLWSSLLNWFVCSPKSKPLTVGFVDSRAARELEHRAINFVLDFLPKENSLEEARVLRSVYFASVAKTIIWKFGRPGVDLGFSGERDWENLRRLYHQVPRLREFFISHLSLLLPTLSPESLGTYKYVVSCYTQEAWTQVVGILQFLLEMGDKNLLSTLRHFTEEMREGRLIVESARVGFTNKGNLIIMETVIESLEATTVLALVRME